MGDLLFVIITLALFILGFSCITLLVDYKEIKDELNKLRFENNLLQSDIKILRGDRVVFDPFDFFKKTNLNINISEVNDDIKDAIKYARDKSHPDNGGSDDDFIKFHKLYQRICKQGDDRHDGE